MHAKLVLKDVNGIFENIETKVFSIDLNDSESLSNDGLFFLEIRLM
jgi:hypothetical protein